MRSRSGPGTVSIVLAVAMNRTLRQIERHIQVVIGEGVILRRVEHFQQRRAGSPRKSAPSLSISSSIMTGLSRAGLAQLGDDSAGHRADVGAAMAADVGLVAHAAQGDADEIPAHGFGDRFAQRSFADARRAKEAENRAAAVRFEFSHGQVFDNPPFDFFQIVMIAIENLPGLFQVDFVVGLHRPGQLADDLQPGADHAVFGAGAGDRLEAAQVRDWPLS